MTKNASKRLMRNATPYCLGLALIGLCGCRDKTPAASEPVVLVQVAVAQMRPISEIVIGDGSLFPLHQASLSPKVTAPVQKFFVNRGDRVQQGQLLAVLENRDLAAAVVTAEGNYDQARAGYATTTSSGLPELLQKSKLDVAAAKASLDAQQKLYDSDRRLLSEGAIARKQVDAAEVALVTARGLYEEALKKQQNLDSGGAAQQKKAAQGQLEASHGQLLAASAQLQYTNIKSPISGVVADRSVYPGDIAAAGTPLFIIMDTSRVVARLHVPQPQAVRLKLGDKGVLKEPGLVQDVNCSVTVLSPALDPSSTTVEVWVEADNSDGRLQPGTTVQSALVAQTIPSALVLPVSSLLNETSGKASVMVVRADGRAYSQLVTVGIKQDQMVQILGGLNPGDRVITTGAYGLPDKTQVKIGSTATSSATTPAGS